MRSLVGRFAGGWGDGNEETPGDVQMSAFGPLQEEYDDDTPAQPSGKRVETWANIISFWIIGMVTDLGYVVILSAAEDLLAGSNTPTAVVLMADIIPTMCIKYLSPFFLHRFSYTAKTTFTWMLFIASFQMVSNFPGITIKLLGIVVGSIACGVGEVTFFAMTTYYSKTVVSAWASGLGSSGPIGSASYLVLRRLGIKTAMNIYTPVPLLIPLCFHLVMSHPYRRARDGDRAQSPHGSAAAANAVPDELSVREKLGIVRSLIPLVLPLAIVYFAEYTINQGVAPVVTFDDAPMSLPTQYVYYYFIYATGQWLGRSTSGLFRVRRLWLLAVLQLSNLLVLAMQAAYGYIPSVFVVFGLVLVEGLTGGIAFVNTFMRMSEEVEPGHREFALSAGTAGDSTGITVASLVSAALEPYLNRVCMHRGRAHCLARKTD